MKWFKHETDALNSEKLSCLIDKAGMAGKGRYYTILEIVAAKMDETDRCSVQFSIAKWGELLDFPRNTRADYIIKFFELLADCALTAVELDPQLSSSSQAVKRNWIRCSVPNLLKKRDNYSKNLQAKSKTLASIEVEVDIDNPPTPLKKGGWESSASSASLQNQKIPCRRKKKETNPDIKKFIDYASQSFKERFNQKLPITGGKDASNVKKMLGQFQYEELVRAWQYYLSANGKDGTWFEQQGRCISNFTTNLPKCLQHQNGPINNIRRIHVFGDTA